MSRNNLLLKSSIKHKLNGRIRLRCEALKYLSNYKNEIKEKISSSSFIDEVEVNTVVGSMLINYKVDTDESRIISFIDGIMAEYDVKVFVTMREKQNTKIEISEKNEETSIDILKRLGLNVAVLGYSMAKGRFGWGYIYNVDRYGRYGRFLTLPAIASIYLNKGLVENGIFGAIKNKRLNADTLTLTSIVANL